MGRETGKFGKEIKIEKFGLGEKRETVHSAPGNQLYTEEIGSTAKKREDLEKWRVDLEWSKEEMRKQEEELEEVEWIILGK